MLRSGEFACMEQSSRKWIGEKDSLRWKKQLVVHLRAILGGGRGGMGHVFHLRARSLCLCT